MDFGNEVRHSECNCGDGDGHHCTFCPLRVAEYSYLAKTQWLSIWCPSSYLFVPSFLAASDRWNYRSSISIFVSNAPPDSDLQRDRSRREKYKFDDYHVELDGGVRNPLPIPATVFDYLGPHGKNVPVQVFETPLVKPSIKAGVTCLALPP